MSKKAKTTRKPKASKPALPTFLLTIQITEMSADKIMLVVKHNQRDIDVPTLMTLELDELGGMWLEQALKGVRTFMQGVHVMYAAEQGELVTYDLPD